jgi:hypothetical protein
MDDGKIAEEVVDSPTERRARGPAFPAQSRNHKQDHMMAPLQTLLKLISV